MFNIYVTSVCSKSGKTFISAGLAATMQSLGYNTCLYKPIQTAGIEINGFMQSPDLTLVKSIDPYINTSFSYLFKADAEPLIASEYDNKFIDLDFINAEYKKITANADCTVIDGDNGLLSPLAPSVQTVDMIKKIQVPVLIVITPNKDSVNQALTTIEIAKLKQIEVRGVVINNIQQNCPSGVLTSITRIIEEYSDTKIVGLVPHLGEKVLPEELISGILNGIDVENIFNTKIQKLDLG